MVALRPGSWSAQRTSVVLVVVDSDLLCWSPEPRAEVLYVLGRTSLESRRTRRARSSVPEATSQEALPAVLGRRELAVAVLSCWQAARGQEFVEEVSVPLVGQASTA